MRTRIFSFLFLCATTSSFGQRYSENIPTLCFCDIHQRMQSTYGYRNNAPYILAPNCEIHKPITTTVVATLSDKAFNVSFFKSFFKKRKKKQQTPKDSQIIVPVD